jgi:hypothetical protein
MPTRKKNAIAPTSTETTCRRRAAVAGDAPAETGKAPGTRPNRSVPTGAAVEVTLRSSCSRCEATEKPSIAPGTDAPTEACAACEAAEEDPRRSSRRWYDLTPEVDRRSETRLITIGVSATTQTTARTTTIMMLTVLVPSLLSRRPYKRLSCD